MPRMRAVDAAVAMAAVAADFTEALRQRNAPVLERLRAVSRERYGTADARALDAVYRAVVDLPHAAVRRHVGSVPRWLDGDVRASARALLLAHRPAANSLSDFT